MDREGGSGVSSLYKGSHAHGGGRESGNNKTVPSSFFSLPLSFSDPEELFVCTDDHYGVMQLCSH